MISPYDLYDCISNEVVCFIKEYEEDLFPSHWKRDKIDSNVDEISKISERSLDYKFETLKEVIKKFDPFIRVEELHSLDDDFTQIDKFDGKHFTYMVLRIDKTAMQKIKDHLDEELRIAKEKRIEDLTKKPPKRFESTCNLF